MMGLMERMAGGGPQHMGRSGMVTGVEYSLWLVDLYNLVGS